MPRRISAFARRGGSKKYCRHLRVDKRFALWPVWSGDINDYSLLLERPLAYRPPAIRFATFAIPLDESFFDLCAQFGV